MAKLVQNDRKASRTKIMTTTLVRGKDTRHVEEGGLQQLKTTSVSNPVSQEQETQATERKFKIGKRPGNVFLIFKCPDSVTICPLQPQNSVLGL